MQRHPTDFRLSDLVIVNENAVYNRAGDISIFRSLKDAELKLEHWYVSKETYFALNGIGQKIIFTAHDDIVSGKVDDSAVSDVATLTLWLTTTAKFYQCSRAHWNVETEMPPQQSLEDMVACIGFTN